MRCPSGQHVRAINNKSRPNESQWFHANSVTFIISTSLATCAGFYRDKRMVHVWHGHLVSVRPPYAGIVSKMLNLSSSNQRCLLAMDSSFRYKISWQNSFGITLNWSSECMWVWKMWFSNNQSINFIDERVKNHWLAMSAPRTGSRR